MTSLAGNSFGISGCITLVTVSKAVSGQQLCPAIVGRNVESPSVPKPAVPTLLRANSWPSNSDTSLWATASARVPVQPKLPASLWQNLVLNRGYSDQVQEVAITQRPPSVAIQAQSVMSWTSLGSSEVEQANSVDVMVSGASVAVPKRKLTCAFEEGEVICTQSIPTHQITCLFLEN